MTMIQTLSLVLLVVIGSAISIVAQHDDDDDDFDFDHVGSFISGLTGEGEDELADYADFENHDIRDVDHEISDFGSDDLDLFDDHDSDEDTADAPGHGRHFQVLAAKSRKARKTAKKYGSRETVLDPPAPRSANVHGFGGGIPQVDPNAPLTPTLKPSFDTFDNAQPQNDGNCFEAVNRERAAAGVGQLSRNATLVNLAAKHSAYMAASQVASHDGFWSYRFDAVPGNVSGVGEVVVADDMLNAANGPAKRAVDRWMGSPEHKMLLLRPDMILFGCSTAEGSDGRFYATAIICAAI